MTLNDLLSNHALLQMVAGLNNIREAASKSKRYEGKDRVNLCDAVIDTSALTDALEKMYDSNSVKASQSSLRINIPKLVNSITRKTSGKDAVLEELLKHNNELSARPSKEDVLEWFETHSAFCTLAKQVKEYRWLSSYVCQIQDQIDREKRIKNCTDQYLKITMQRQFDRRTGPYVSDAKKVLKDKLIEIEHLSYKMIATLVELDNVYNIGK